MKNRHRTSLVVLATALALIVASCAAAGSEGDPTVTSPSSESPEIATLDSTAGDRPAVGAFPEGPSALRTLLAEEFPEPLVDVSAIISGGPPPDGIPPTRRPDLSRRRRDCFDTARGGGSRCSCHKRRRAGISGPGDDLARDRQ